MPSSSRIPPLVVPRNVTLIAPVTGENSSNHTASRFGFSATDLGILWDDGAGGVLAAFGDTYGAGWHGPGAGHRSADHRRNVLLRSTSTRLERGLDLAEAVEDRPGHAAELLPADPRQRIESTVIPTAGIAVDGVQYLHYMSVRRWGRPGRWRTNYGGIASSRDGGRTWYKHPDAHWPNSLLGRRPFQLGAFARDPADPEWVYLFGTRNGRYGPVFLARAPRSALAQPWRYQVWTRRGWRRYRRWGWHVAAPVTPGPSGELSAAFHSGLGVWLMVHLEDRAGRIVLRAAHRPTGPWSEGQLLVAGTDYPGLYGGYLHPGALSGSDIYFTMSQWGPYNVYLMHADLELRSCQLE